MPKTLSGEQRLRLWSRLSKRFAQGQIVITIDYPTKSVRADGVIGESRHASGSGRTLDEALQQLSRTS